MRYYSDNHNEVRVGFLKAAVFCHVYAESVANELCETLQKFSLPLIYFHYHLMDQMSTKQLRQTSTVSSRQSYQRELVDTGPCQLHVVHNSFRKGVEGYGSDVENLCIDIYYFFKLSPPRREDYADVQQKLNLDEFIFLWHVQSW